MINNKVRRRGMRRAEANIIRFVKERGVYGTQGIADFLTGCDSETVRDEDNVLHAGVSGSCSAGTLSLGNISSRPVLLRSVGKPLWEFADPRHFVKALLAIVAGIGVLERKNILHGDINAGNVFLSLDPREGHEAFLADFEFASVDELRTIKAVVDDHHPADVVQMLNERRVPEKATNTLTTWIIERGPEMMGTMQFMAVDVLKNIITRKNAQGRHRVEFSTAPVDFDETMDLIPRGVKHDLESLVWVAEYAVYRRAYEKAKECGDKVRFERILDSMKQEFGQVTAKRIVEQRHNTYSAAFGQNVTPDTIYEVVERPLYGMMRALLDEVELQNMVPAHLLPDYPQYQTIGKNRGRQDKIPADAGKPMTCKGMEEVLNDCLKAYSLD